MINILFILMGIISGVAGGMGMGGGTLLIPLITIFLGVEQKQAQLLNIISFIFMVCVVGWIFIKNKLICVFPATLFAFIGIFTAIFSAMLVKNIQNSILKTIYGVVLITIATIQAVVFIIKAKQKK